MKQTIGLLVVTLFLMSCNQFNTEGNSINGAQSQSASAIDTIPKVTGIGGIFIKSSNPTETKAWYRDNLGLAVDDYGSPFEFRNAHRPDELNYLNWDLFPDTTSYFDPSVKEVMINYRVQNIEGLVRNLKRNGVTIVDEIVAYEYGKFVHIMDSDGNKIELWEPVDSVLATMGRETTK